MNVLFSRVLCLGLRLSQDQPLTICCFCKVWSQSNYWEICGKLVSSKGMIGPEASRKHYLIPVHHKICATVLDEGMLGPLALAWELPFGSSRLQDVQICPWWRHSWVFESRWCSDAGTRVWPSSLYLFITGCQKFSDSNKNTMLYRSRWRCVRACNPRWRSGLCLSKRHF